jgi:RNA polymerase sigma-70 factor (ECF subfamily)
MTLTTFAFEESRSNPMQRSASLVCAAQSGSSAAFSELHSLYERRIYRTILSITQNREDAEDAMQETFLRAYLAIGKFEGRANFYSWLTRIAINSGLMVLRKRRVRAAFLIDLPYDPQEEEVALDFKDASPTPEQSYRDKQEHLKLVKAIQRLGPRLRVVVEEHLGQDGSLREVARTLDISEAAVKSRLYRARKRLATTGARTVLSV